MNKIHTYITPEKHTKYKEKSIESNDSKMVEDDCQIKKKSDQRIPLV